MPEYHSWNIDEETNERLIQWIESETSVASKVEGMRRVADTLEALQAYDVTPEKLAAAATASDGGAVETDHSDLAREVAARIDYAELARKTADNLREEMR